MGAHSHHHGDHDDVEVGGTARVVLLASLAGVALATLIGLFTLWPDADDRPDSAPYMADGVSRVEGEIVTIGDPCPVIAADPAAGDGQQPPRELPEDCNMLEVRVLDGPDADSRQTMQVPPYLVHSDVSRGDVVDLTRMPTPEQARASGAPEAVYGFVKVKRDFPLLAMTIIFVLVVAVVARLRGVLALVGLGLAGLVVGKFMLPALLAGGPGIAIAMVGSTVIMYIVLYLAHGPSIRTSTALAGTLIGIAITALIGMAGVRSANLAGVSDDTGERLLVHAEGLDFQALLMSAIIIAGLGVLNDVTITQSSAVWELRAAAPGMSRMGLFRSGMRIGRDHIASTIYTIVFAYTGTALALLMLLSLYDRSFLDVVSDDLISEEVVRTLASVIGLVLAVPVTTGIAAMTVSGPRGGVGEDELEPVG